jgi:hypothetical protein
MKYFFTMAVAFFITNCYADKLINFQCSDNSPTKILNGYTFKLSDACSKFGLTGDSCCWNSISRYYHGDSNDTCGQYRQNPNCKFVSNTCSSTDPLSGACTKANSTYNCASAYRQVESTICTAAICVNNKNYSETDSANNCFMPADITSKRNNATGKNVADLASILSFLEIGKQGGGDLQACAGGDPQNCVIFKGDYYTCDIYNPDSPWNNGSDCMVHNDYFSANMAGQNLSDKAMYGSVTANRADANGYYTNGNNYAVGDRYSYGLSNQDQQTINSINYNVQTLQNSNRKTYNQDTGAAANPNGQSKYMSLKNSQINSVTMSNYAADHLGTWDQYLSQGSAKLAWNRIKADPNPFNAKKMTLSDLGVSRSVPGGVDGWGGDKPIYTQGLCLYLSNFNDGGNQADTDSVAGRVVCMGNANCGAVCTNRDPITGICLTASAMATREEWCCYNSKLSMDINLAAWDQGILSPYKANSKYINGGNVARSGNKCGGVTINQLSKIDFSKGNYFKDFQNSITVPNMSNVVNVNSVTGGAQGSIQGRVNNTMSNKIQSAK